MKTTSLDAQADHLIADAIAEGRLSPRPSMETLNRIASIIAPVLAATPARGSVTVKKKVAEPHLSTTSRRARHDRTQVRR